MDMMNRKKLVVIGANDFQNQLIIAAKKRNLETHVFAWQEGAVGAENADFFYPISIVEKEKILDICKEIKPDGVISIASDLASLTVNYLAEKLDLIGNGMESAMLSTNKYLMRRQFELNGDPSPKNWRSDQLNKAVFREMSYPVIVKPVDRSGSRGITKVMKPEELKSAIELAESLSFDHKAMIEEYVEGEEYSVEYITYKGKHFFLALTKKFTTGAPNYIETGHLQPAKVKPYIVNKIKIVVEHALNSLKIQNGASHSEIKVDQNGKITIIEIGGRMGGDCIGSDLVKLSTGYDFIEMVIDVALGEQPNFEIVCVPSVAEIHFIFNESDLKRLEELKRENPDSIYRISKIEKMDGHKVEDSSTRYGYYITKEKKDVRF